MVRDQNGINFPGTVSTHWVATIEMNFSVHVDRKLHDSHKTANATDHLFNKCNTIPLSPNISINDDDDNNDDDDERLQKLGVSLPDPANLLLIGVARPEAGVPCPPVVGVEERGLWGFPETRPRGLMWGRRSRVPSIHVSGRSIIACHIEISSPLESIQFSIFP